MNQEDGPRMDELPICRRTRRSIGKTAKRSIEGIERVERAERRSFGRMARPTLLRLATGSSESRFARAAWSLALLLPLVSACASAPAAAPRPAPLASVVDSVTTTPPLERTHWGVEAYDPERGRTLLRLNPEKHFVPASNMKLVVTAVALAELGPDFRYHTELFAPRAAEDSIAERIVVVGRGDPTLSGRFFESDVAPIEMLADSVRLAGVRRVRGDVVVDASYFDAELVHPAWEVGDLPWYYAAPVAAFGIAEGAVPMVVEPGAAPGEPAVITFPEPAEAFILDNRLVTDTAGAGRAIRVTRLPGSYRLDVAGRVALDAARDTLWLSVVEPAAHAGRALVAALERRGIKVEGDVRVVYDTAAAAALLPAGGDARRVALWQSPPLTEIVAAILKPSQNWIAEHLLKTLGAERGERGSWWAGLEVERRYLSERAGIDTAAVYLSDGSGLSAQNLLTPHAVVQLLDHARRQPWGAAYRAGLPEPGEEVGTLERRLQGFEGRVEAKTGTIAHVNSLSGYLRTERGDVIFSVLSNGSGVRSTLVRQAIDRIVAAMAEEGGR